jgi:hypothetical protein
MSQEFLKYKAQATSLKLQGDPEIEWQRIFDWYNAEGRQLFIDAFAKETGIRLTNTPGQDDLVAAAIPKSYGDLNSKAKSDAFYRAHGFWFVEEMDNIVKRVPRQGNSPADANSFGDVLRFVSKVLLDSVLLFEHWGTHRAEVPGVYGIGKNDIEHIMAFYQGARQTIYGHGSWSLSFPDNHADLATATIRQAVEIRVRRAFGVMAKISKADGGIHPIPFSDLLEAIEPHKANVQLPVRFENVVRINGWANMYLHAALKLYAWCPPRVLEFLRVFLLGGKAPGWFHNSKAGVVVDRATFDAVRNLIRQEHEGATFDLALLDADHCEALIR